MFLFFDQTGCPLAGLRRAQPNRGPKMAQWNGFDFLYYYLDRINKIIRIFSPAARGLSAEGRIILSILLILSNSFI